jgi:serine O-acetyltransferase
MLENVKQDYCASMRRTGKPANLARMLWRAMQDATFRAVFLYRIGRWCRLHRHPLGAALAERLMRHLSHCWISTLAELGPGFRIAHVCGIIVPPGIVFGANCEIRQNVTLGGNYGKRGPDGRTNPILGDDVSIGPGAVILGPIHVGSHTIVGANAVVTQSVPPYSVVTGFRAEVLATRTAEGAIVRDDKRVFLSRRELFERLSELERRVAAMEAGRELPKEPTVEVRGEAPECA